MAAFANIRRSESPDWLAPVVATVVGRPGALALWAIPPWAGSCMWLRNAMICFILMEPSGRTPAR